MKTLRKRYELQHLAQFSNKIAKVKDCQKCVRGGAWRRLPMYKRVVGIEKETGREVPVASNRVLLSSLEYERPGDRLRLEHCVFNGVDKPVITVNNPYIALVLGNPLLHRKEGSTWRQYQFVSGQMSIRPPGDIPAAQSKDDCEVVLVSIDSGLLTDMAGQMALCKNVELIDNFAADSDLLRATIFALRDEVAEGFSGGRMYLESLQTMIASQLLTHHSTWNPNAVESRGNGGGLGPQELKRVEDYIAENLSADISLTELAQVAFMSSYHFSRMFKKSTGVSPFTYLSNVRTQRAAALMRMGNVDTSQIAQAAGFRDSRALHRQFKRLFGESPASYMKQLRDQR